jgi:hypothetical protein
MKIHDKKCTSCTKTEGEAECFDDLGEMMDYHKSQRKWYEVAWDFVYYPCWRIFDKIRYFPKECKWFIQRGRRGWSDCDSWNVYAHIAEIIPPMLKQMKEAGYGFPVLMYEDFTKYEYTDEEGEAARAKWNTILDSIIQAFEIENGISNGDLLDLGTRPTKKQKEFGKEHCEKFDMKLLTNKDRQVRKEGWKNFQLYFHNLWD